MLFKGVCVRSVISAGVGNLGGCCVVVLCVV